MNRQGHSKKVISDKCFLRVLDAINKSQNLEQLLKCVLGIFPDISVSYHHFGAVGSFDYTDVCQFHYHNMPDVIIEYLDKHRKVESNPAVVAVLSKGQYMWLTELLDDPYIVEQDHVARTLATIALIGDALCLPLYGPNSRSGYMFISIGHGKYDCDETLAWKIQGLAQRFHVRYCLILEKRNKYVKLTPREASVLELISFGKSNAEIATILEISPNTVGGHVKRIFLKLDVSERVSAAMRAQTLSVTAMPNQNSRPLLLPTQNHS